MPNVLELGKKKKKNLFREYVSPLPLTAGEHTVNGSYRGEGRNIHPKQKQGILPPELGYHLLLSHLKFTPNIIPSQVVRGVPHTLRHSSCHIDGGLFSYYVNT